MSQFLLYCTAGMLLFAIGAHGLFVRRHLFRQVLALNIMGTAVCLVLVAVSQRNAAETPDPVPQALVLTGIVVAVSATALGLTLARRFVEETRSTSLFDHQSD